MLATYMLNKIEFAPDNILANQALVVILGPVGGIHMLFPSFDRLEKTVASYALNAAVRKT
jgi:hypothetical protein